MAIKGSDALAKFGQRFEKMAVNMPPSPTRDNYKIYTYTRDIPGVTDWVCGFISEQPDAEDWEGTKVYSFVRANAPTLRVKDKHASFKFPLVQVKQNPEAVFTDLEEELRNNSDFTNKLVIQGILRGSGSAAEAGYDGVAPWSQSHPLGGNISGSSTWSNLHHLAFSEGAFEYVMSNGMGLTDVTGRPLSIQYDTIVFGPDLVPAVQEVLAADLVGNGVSNMNKGRIKNFVYEPRFVGTEKKYWMLVDSRRRLFGVGIAQDWEPSTDADQHKDENQVKFSMEAQLALGFIYPQAGALCAAF